MQSTTFIPAKPSSLAKLFWGWWFNRSVRRSFHSVLISGDEELTRIISGRTSTPIILVCTHGSWWDAAITIVLSLRIYKLDALGMMEYKQLRKYKFFRRIGMFSVVREDPRSAISSVEYAAEQLRGTNRALWIFPQGTLIQQDLRPIKLESGFARIAHKVAHKTGECYIVPIAIRYELLHEQRPDAYIRVGQPVLFRTVETTTVEIVEQMRAQLEYLYDMAKHDAADRNVSGYRRLFRGRLSMEKRLDKIKGEK